MSKGVSRGLGHAMNWMACKSRGRLLMRAATARNPLDMFACRTARTPTMVDGIASTARDALALGLMGRSAAAWLVPRQATTHVGCNEERGLGLQRPHDRRASFGCGPFFGATAR